MRNISVLLASAAVLVSSLSLAAEPSEVDGNEWFTDQEMPMFTPTPVSPNSPCGAAVLMWSSKKQSKVLVPLPVDACARVLQVISSGKGNSGWL